MADGNDGLAGAALAAVAEVDGYRRGVAEAGQGTDVDDLWGLVLELRERLAAALELEGIPVPAYDAEEPAAPRM